MQELLVGLGGVRKVCGGQVGVEQAEGMQVRGGRRVAITAQHLDLRDLTEGLRQMRAESQAIVARILPAATQ